ncbi:NDR1/HIN1-like protein 2 [Hevea brasiliensis]|uniref:NDR1/HIN1-like protein 2 n=1 Tax=Hevea brasiliensis TaxID=3981 RepID=UPI000B790EBF|nr:NDR1/HIN1-like protein 2 [Hevea brasiliensis]
MALHKDTKAQLSVYLWFLQVFVVLASISYLIWICLTPKYPIYTITSVNIPLSHGSNSTLHHQRVAPNTSIILLLQISNPNQGLGIYCDDIHLALHYNDSVIGNKSLQGFYEGYGENISLRVPVNPSHKFWFWRGTTSSINVRVSLKNRIKFKYKIFRTVTKHHQIDVEASLPIGLNGKILGNLNINLQNSVKARPTRKGN